MSGTFSWADASPWRDWLVRAPLAGLDTMMSFQLRSQTPTLLFASSADAEALASVHGAAFPLEGEQWGKKAFEELLRQSGVFALKAVHHSRVGEGELAPRGFALVREAGGDAEILTIAVHPAWQGRAIGRLLMEEVLRELYARRVVSLYLEVADDNAAAVRLYKRLGFDQVGRREGYYRRPGEDAAALTMRLDL